MAKITFVVSGVEQASVSRGGAVAVSERSGPGRVKQSVRVIAERAAGEIARMEAVPGQDVVVLHIANGPSLWLHPETARDLLASQHDPSGLKESAVGSSRVDLQACKLEYSIVSPK